MACQRDGQQAIVVIAPAKSRSSVSSGTHVQAGARADGMGMADQCTKCGEDLLGSVNRCWRCGQKLLPHSPASDLPPPRQDTPSANPEHQQDQVLLAELLDSPQSGGSIAGAHRDQAPTGDTPANKWIRRGSPFADRGQFVVERIRDVNSKKLPRGAALFRSPIPPSQRPRRDRAAACASLSLALASASLLCAFCLPIGGLILAVFGILAGTWGLISRYPRVALIGLLLCSLSFMIAVVQLVFAIYG